jgi:2-amino-4-hydroxy-6-hydroxymethyldihydropteridine diphosphokinase
LFPYYPCRVSRVTAYIALGSNLGDRAAHVQFALHELARSPETVVTAASDFIETEPVGGPSQPAYLNAAAALSTRLPPRELLNHLLEIEQRRGRTRSAESRWGPRTLDLDLLLFGALVANEPGLAIPHPRLHERRFVLEPLAQIAPGAIIPTLGITVADALHHIGAAR